jgi:diguanylate cyclase (GGDEF)-like protein/PAS domain S-box-containing protein
LDPVHRVPAGRAAPGDTMPSAQRLPDPVATSADTPENLGARLSRILSATDERATDVAATTCLEELCRFTGANRGFVVIFDEQARVAQQWRWDNSGRPFVLPANGTPLDEFSGSVAAFLRIGRTLAVGDLTELELGPEELAYIEANGGLPRAAMMLPVMVAGQLVGLVSVQSMDEPRDWTRALIGHMEIFSEVLVRMLGRTRERQALVAATIRANRIAAHLPDGLVMLSIDGCINWVSPSFEAMSSLSSQELENRPFTELVAPSDRGPLVEQLSLVTAGPDAAIAVRISDPAGDWRWADLSLSLASEPHSGVPDEIVITVRDSHDRHLREQRLVQKSDRDSLTGLANRGALDHFIAELSDSDVPVMVAFCDIDDFKRFNDDGGHDAGDEVLRSTSSAIARAVRSRDMVARVGGDEFVVIVVEPGPAAARLGDRLVLAIRALAAEGRGEPTMSIGVCGPAPASSAREMVRLADEAMYTAKQAGKDRWVRATLRSRSWSELLGPQ